jgi:hypothetical protein
VTKVADSNSIAVKMAWRLRRIFREKGGEQTITFISDAECLLNVL